ncbi:MAG: tetratricopeptide repeat protein [Deltaproteobacteria bacterium]|nr:tetratricopeptide repeat protein [Deltaproteobacteria bacterium]
MKTLVFAILISFFTLPFAQARYQVRPLDQAILHNNKGVGYLNQQNLKKALHEFKIAAELSPEYSDAWNNLCLTYIYLKQYQKAEESCLTSIKYDKKFASPYNHLATLYYTLGDYEKAASWAKKAVKKEKFFADAHYNHGLIYAKLVDKDSKYYEEAEQSFRHAIEADPRHYLAHYELGNLYKKQKRYEEAMIRYKSALEIQPSAAQVWRALADLYKLEGRFEKAEFALNKAMAASGGKGLDNHLSLAEFYIRENNFTLARRELDKARANDPNNPNLAFQEAYFKLVEAENTRAQKGVEAAQSLYQQAINAFQNLESTLPTPNVYYNIGYLYSRVNNFRQALVYFEKALAKDPEHADSLFSYAVVELSLGEEKKGFKDLCQFLKISKDQLAQETKRQIAKGLFQQHKKSCSY